MDQAAGSSSSSARRAGAPNVPQHRRDPYASSTSGTAAATATATAPAAGSAAATTTTMRRSPYGPPAAVAAAASAPRPAVRRRARGGAATAGTASASSALLTPPTQRRPPSVAAAATPSRANPSDRNGHSRESFESSTRVAADRAEPRRKDLPGLAEESDDDSSDDRSGEGRGRGGDGPPAASAAAAAAGAARFGRPPRLQAQVAPSTGQQSAFAALLPRHHHPLRAPTDGPAAAKSSSLRHRGAAGPRRDGGDPRHPAPKTAAATAAAAAAKKLRTVRDGGIDSSARLDITLLRAVAYRGRTTLDALLGKRVRLNRSEERAVRRFERTAAARYRKYLLAVPVLAAAVMVGPRGLDEVTKPPKWNWTPSRRLDGRRCAMNLFIEKLPKDEYDPDFVEIKPGEKNKDGTPKVPTPPKVLEGTYRTKGQVHVASRFIEAVADSFRSNTRIRQHVIFAGTRDGGHLAQVSRDHWPPRGMFRTQFHIIADDVADDDSEEALGYGSMAKIEERFRGEENVRIYSREGKAGLLGDDDDADEPENLRDDDAVDPFGSAARNGTRPYPNLEELLPIDDEDNPVVVPYLHVDGRTHASQSEILESARPLLERQAIKAVGVEHSSDLDIPALIAHFTELDYKTFFLGSRQLARLDHLCDEILAEILYHPSVDMTGPYGRDSNPIRNLLMKAGVLDDPVSHMKALPEGTRLSYPPFLVALPRGRRTRDGTHDGREEMTIQHMYDLFGGYGGGGGQIKTANDRKAPGKK